MRPVLPDSQAGWIRPQGLDHCAALTRFGHFSPMGCPRPSGGLISCASRAAGGFAVRKGIEQLGLHQPAAPARCARERSRSSTSRAQSAAALQAAHGRHSPRSACVLQSPAASPCASCLHVCAAGTQCAKTQPGLAGSTLGQAITMADEAWLVLITGELLHALPFVIWLGAPWIVPGHIPC